MKANEQAVEKDGVTAASGRPEGCGGGEPAVEAAPGGPVFTARLYKVRKACGVTLTTTAPPTPHVHVPVRRPARIAIMLALAHKLQQAIDEGKVKDGAEVARRLGVSRARVAQILGLALLPVADQERILWLEAVDGREPGPRGERTSPSGCPVCNVGHRTGVDKIAGEGQ